MGTSREEANEDAGEVRGAGEGRGARDDKDEREGADVVAQDAPRAAGAPHAAAVAREEQREVRREDVRREEQALGALDEHDGVVLRLLRGAAVRVRIIAVSVGVEQLRLDRGRHERRAERVEHALGRVVERGRRGRVCRGVEAHHVHAPVRGAGAVGSKEAVRCEAHEALVVAPLPLVVVVVVLLLAGRVGGRVGWRVRGLEAVDVEERMAVCGDTAEQEAADAVVIAELHCARPPARTAMDAAVVGG